MVGLHGYFKKASYEEREHAEMFLKYLNQRGGRIVLQDIASLEVNENMTALDAMQKALELEKEVNQVDKLFHFLLTIIQCYYNYRAFLTCTA